MTLLDSIDWYAWFFGLFALLAGGFAAAVLLTNNIVRMAFFLTLSLGATAGLFFLAGAEFVGALQLMVYVGGTLVLLVFGVMLTAQATFVVMRPRSGEWVAALLASSLLLGLLLSTAWSVGSWRAPRPAEALALAAGQSATAVGAALTGVRVDRLADPADPAQQSRTFSRSGYLFPFLIVSVHLLVVLVGAAYLARPRTAQQGLGAEQGA